MTRTNLSLRKGNPGGCRLRFLRFWQAASRLFIVFWFFCFLFLAVSRLLGMERYIVLSGSMSPAIPVGSCIFVKPASFAQVREGDIITWQTTGQSPVTVTHRVVSVNAKDRTITTKGDANAVPDPVPVTENQLLGIVKYYLPEIGFLLYRLDCPAGFCSAVFLLLLAVVTQGGCTRMHVTCQRHLAARFQERNKCYDKE